MTALRYRYYILGNATYVRVTCNASGSKTGAEWLNPKTGRLEIAHTLLSRIEQNWEVEEIDAATFERMGRMQ